MVHALREIRRVLVKNGILLDLRPVLDQWPIEVVSARGVQKTGNFQDSPAGIADDEAAKQSLARAEQEGWFLRQAEDIFPYIYSWDTPSELEERIEAEWHDFLQLEEHVRRATRSAWAAADADARVQVKVKMLITRWKVIKDS